MNSAIKLWFDLALLSWEMQQVIWLRSLRLAVGGATGSKAWADAEAARMVTEKAAAHAVAALDIAAGADAPRVIRGYRKKVRANLRRLQG